MANRLAQLADAVRNIDVEARIGRVVKASTGFIEVAGLSRHGCQGDPVEVTTSCGTYPGEIIALDERTATVMIAGNDAAAAIGDHVRLLDATDLWPSDNWVGRMLDAKAQPIDGKPLTEGFARRPVRANPPAPGARKRLGPRVGTGLCVMDTILPIARGQRIGIFAGSGVGKTSLLASLARGVEADRVVIGLIGERGREVREFVDVALGPEGMAKTTLIAATSDQSPLLKRRAAWTATAVAEHFRDKGEHVLLIIDSLTRFAEAHREIALTAGEPPSLRAYPPSTATAISALTERAGPGVDGTGDITAIYSVLVAGSDMDEPIADITRGLLDGHVVLDREIAERGRFPAIDVRRSVSRSLPGVASPDENALIAEARRVLAAYESIETLVKTGLYSAGSDPALDRAISLWPGLDAFAAEGNSPTPAASFERLAVVLGVDFQQPSTNEPA